MIGCKALRCSSARFGPHATKIHYAWRLQARSHSSPAAPNKIRRDDGEPVEIDVENKTVKTVAGELPLSPVMDPAYWEATTRHRKRKPRAGKAQNSLERQFRANPFAQALATEFRRCSLTRTRVPKFFLQEFQLLQHPGTGRPFWVPRFDGYAESPEKDDADQKSIGETLAEAGDEAQTAANNSSEATWEIREEDSGKPHGTAGYCLARHNLISALWPPSSKFPRGPIGLYHGNSSKYRNFAPVAQWRADMDTYLLSQMREDAANHLRYLAKLCTEDQRHYIVKCWGWNDVQYKHKGAVLWFGEPSEDGNPERTPPGSFAAMELKGTDTAGAEMKTSLTVHNMLMLLGDDLANSVKAQTQVLQDGAIFMLAGRRTAPLQSKLWKLQGYLADVPYSRHD